MLNRETHSICDECWKVRSPGRQPFRVKPEWVEEEPCCFCGAKTESGIFVLEYADALSHCPGHADD